MAESLIAFAGVAALLTITPGADMALVTRSALSYGRRSAIATSFGISAGLLVWGIASAVGLAALLSASATAFLIVKIAGATYLVLLGIRTIVRARRRASSGGDGFSGPISGGLSGTAPSGGLPAGRTAFGQGLLTNLLNPKIAVFYTTVLPQFMSPGGSPLLMSVALALVHVALTLLWLSAYAHALTRAGRALHRPRVRAALEYATGAVLVALGLRLAVTER